MENNQPIIIKRVKRFAAGPHGGAWKIAFADFATAMMAFFLVLWLMSTATPEQKIAIAGYFKDPDCHLFEVDYETVWLFDQHHQLVVDRIAGANP